MPVLRVFLGVFLGCFWGVLGGVFKITYTCKYQEYAKKNYRAHNLALTLCVC